MNILRINKPRLITYYSDLLSDELDNLIHDSESYQAFKLKIKQRHFESEQGEMNFLIRDKTNNLKYIILYCFMDEPEIIKDCDYYVNNILKLPSKETIITEPFIDGEVAELYVKDLIFNNLQKKYKLL